MRRLGVLAVLLLLLPLRAQETQAPEKPPTAVPPYLRGVDMSLPSQSAFRHWPPKELEERPYWLPWNVLSLGRAEVTRQPIFLMLTVPWSRPAQRMAKGALADPKVLRTLNQDFVAIAVRADRRPDITARYGSGEWPSIALLLPDGSPMLSQANPRGVALPITLGYSEVAGVMNLLQDGRLYFDKWENVLHGVSQIYEKRVDLEESKPGDVSIKAADQEVRWLLGNADAKYGGFGAAPKYALPGLMELALVRAARQQQPSLVEAARDTLVKLAAGPLHDARDGGFHRMAAAPEWGAIQYEKMLLGNAEVLRDLTFALRNGDDPALRAAAADTARFLTTVLARPGGGFFNAQIADPASTDGGEYWRTAKPGTAPPVDRAVFSGPNALAGAALLRAGAVLNDASLEAAGRAAIDLVLEKGVETGRGALHVIEPDPEHERFLSTQADVAFALLDAHESTGDARYLAAAADIATFVSGNLKVGDETAFRDVLPSGHPVGIMDMAIRPMGANTRCARVLNRLWRLGALSDGRERAEQVLSNFAGDLSGYGVRGIEPALAIEEVLGEPVIVRIEGPPAAAETRALRRAALTLSRAFTIVATAPGSSASATLSYKAATRQTSDPKHLPAELAALVETSVGAP
ncbi:MAG TPA: DUF255 domain-containing protein [Candidatus Polarisedimenticolaceae bacterium]|nr:DUF255 domain-containing protein [Candidatus Polarisedimenticolaceae bacterium]